MDCNKSESAEDILERCIRAGVAQDIPVKGLVAEWISFAGRYPDCFKELFTTREFSSMDYLADRIGHKEECLDYLRATLKYDEDGTLRLYHDILLQTYGLCCLAAFAAYKFSEQEIDVRLGRSVLMQAADIRLCQPRRTGPVPSQEAAFRAG